MSAWTRGRFRPGTSAQFRAALVALFLLALFAVSTAKAEVNLDGLVSVTRSGFVFNRENNTYDTTLRLQNISSQAIGGRLAIAVSNISAASVSLDEVAGFLFDGTPFVAVLPNRTVAPEQALDEVVLRFRNPSRVTFGFTVHVYGDLSEQQFGVLLPGPADALMQSATYDLTGLRVRSDEIEVVGKRLRIPTTRLVIMFREGINVGQVNSLLTSIGGKIVSMLKGSRVVSIRLATPRSALALEALAEQLEGLPFVEVASLDFIPVPAMLPTDKAGVAPDLNVIDHLLAVRAHAAWNAMAAIQPAAKPMILFADEFGRSAPSKNKEFRVDDKSSDFADLPWLQVGGHGYQTLSVVAANFDASAIPTSQTTGIFPAVISIRAIDLADILYFRLSYMETFDNVSNKIIHLVKRQSYKRIVVVTPIGCGSSAAEVSACRRIISKLAYTWVANIRILNLENKFIHTTAAGNDGSVKAVDADVYSFASLPGGLSATGFLTAPLANTLSVMDYENSAIQPFRPAGRNSLGSPGGHLGAIGSDVTTLTPFPFCEVEPPAFTPSSPYCVNSGSSLATPAVAGVAAFVWSVNPSLNSIQVVDRILRTARDGVLDAYAAVLAADTSLQVAPARRAILDIADPALPKQRDKPNGKFDHEDIRQFLEEFTNRRGAIDYSRYELNGDGYTGGDKKDRFDLDINSPPAWSTASASIGGLAKTFDEKSLTDLDILCYYAYSPLYDKELDPDGAHRAKLLGDTCGWIVLSSTTAHYPEGTVCSVDIFRGPGGAQITIIRCYGFSGQSIKQYVDLAYLPSATTPIDVQGVDIVISPKPDFSSTYNWSWSNISSAVVIEIPKIGFWASI